MFFFANPIKIKIRGLSLQLKKEAWFEILSHIVSSKVIACVKSNCDESACLHPLLQFVNYWQPCLMEKHSTPTLLLLCLPINLMDPQIQTSVPHSQSILQGRNPAERCSQTKSSGGQVSCQSILSPAGSLKKKNFDCHVMLIIQNKFIFTKCRQCWVEEMKQAFLVCLFIILDTVTCILIIIVTWLCLNMSQIFFDPGRHQNQQQVCNPKRETY